MKLGIITYIQHKEHRRKYFSYTPYVNEMNIWFKYADEVSVVAPKIKSIPNVIESAYNFENIGFIPIPSINFTSVGNSFISFFKLPVIFWRIFREFKRVDHIHLRCPGNVGLIACMVQIFFPGKTKTVKYAGNWDPESIQPWSYRLQKWILSNTFLSRNMKVLVYGKWPKQSANIVPFFTASFSREERENVQKDFNTPYNLLFVGSLNDGKRPLFAIQMLEEIIKNGIPVKLKIYGDGKLKSELQTYIETQNLAPFVSLMGNQNLESLKEEYKSSHFLILPSRSEGWPKAVAEAMFFGCIPVSTAVSCVPWMLQDGKRGILIEAGLKPATDKLVEKIGMPEELERMSKNAQKWSQEYTLEKFEREISKLL